MSKEIEIVKYQSLLGEIKTAIQHARLRATLTANAEMILLYWQTGKLIAERQQQEGWSAKVIPRLAADLKQAFPDLKGFSERNLGRMLAFYKEYQADTILPQLVAKLPETQNLQQGVTNLPHLVTSVPWGHTILLMEKVKDKAVRHWYMQQTIEKGWSRDWLLNTIKMDSYAYAQKQIKSHNFSETLPSIHTDYATEVFKDAYHLGFLGITEKVKESELEKRLVEKIKSFVLELGKGFTFIGNQYRLEYRAMPLNCHKHLFLYEDGGAMPLNCRKPIFLYEDGGAMPLNLVMNKILGRSPQIFVERNKKEIKKGA